MDTLVTYPSVEGAQDPYPFYGYLRDHAPVYQLPDRPHVFLVSRYEDVRRALAQPEVFSSRGSRSGLNPFELTSGESETVGMADVDGDEHRRKRALAFHPIKPGRLDEYAVRIHELIDQLIDEMPRRGRVDFVEAFAKQLPFRLTLSLMGVPDEDIEWIRIWGDLEGVGLSWLPADRQERQRTNGARMGAYLTEKVAERHVRPGDDVLSLMIREQVERDGELDLPEVRVQAALLLAGGINSTAHALASTMLLLLRDAEELERVRADSTRIPRMIEEALRVESPNQWLPRRVVSDCEIQGRRLEAGVFVCLLQGSANRDPRKFDAPERFDVDRPNATEHLAFGHGPHFCLGAPLARLDMRIAWETLLERLPEIRLAGDNDFEYIPSPSFRGLRRLNLDVVRAP